MSSSKINPGSRIILGIDIGTTYSAVSFTYRSEKVHHVSEWPGQEAQPGECKVPSLVCYDDQDKPVCFGSEAINLEVLNETTAKGWTLVRCFKRHNYPPSTARGSFILESLPFSVSLSTVYTDYLRYLLSHTESYFTNHVINGRSLWTEQSSDMLIALAHPNSWPLSNQRLLEHAVRSLGGAYQDCEIQFITESEASLHFCIASSNISWTLQPGTIFTVCDAGGSSFEINTYYIEKSSPAFGVKKLANEYFTQAGGASVDLECRRYLTQKLRSSRLSQADVRDYVEYGVRDFSSRVKVQFSSSQSSFHIKLSEANFTEPSLGIKSGSICLSGPTIESFFNPYVSFLVELLRQQASKLKSKHILLVGGSGKSLYLRRKLSNEVLSYDCQVLVMDDFFVKAVADGAVIGMTNAAVVTPSTQLSYGTMVRVRYDPSNPEHQGRKVTRGHGGYDGIVGRWSELLGAGIILSAHTVIRHKFIKSYKPEQNAYDDLNWYTDDIWAFHGESRSNAGWVEDTNGGINPGFEKLCQVEANLSSMRHQLQRKEGPDGVYDILEFFLVIQSSGPDLCAYFEWEEKGVSRRGPITVIPKLVDLCEKSSKLPSNNCY